MDRAFDTKPTEMTSLTEIKARLAAIERQQKETQEGLLIWMKAQREAISAIEQGQGALLAGLDDGFDSMIKRLDALASSYAGLAKKLDCLQGKELLSQFKAKPKRRKKR